MRLHKYIFEERGQKMKMGDDTIVTLTGRTKIRGGLKLQQVIVPWTDKQMKKRKEHGLEHDSPEGLYHWIAEDQLEEIK
jgi:hypothetical protein